MNEDLHRLSATALQAKLTLGEITSVSLVESCLARIDRHNGRLNCLLSIRPQTQLLAHASLLDAERRARPDTLRSKLHGIPIILKDVIVTGPELGMPTTVGSELFAGMTAKRNAPLVDRLQEAGMIILGKSNMTEFCGIRSRFHRPGWSTRGGQTSSPYRRRDLPEGDQPITSGSSSGSAVAVAAGFAPLAIGSETSGGLVYPASLCGVYAYKCGHDTVPMKGVFSISESYDCVGSIARGPADIIALTEILQQKSRLGVVLSPAHAPPGQEFRDLAVGVVASTWGVDKSLLGKWGDARVIREYEHAVSEMRRHGASVIYPLQAAGPDCKVVFDGENLITASYSGFSCRMKEFIRCFESTTIKDLHDVMEWYHARYREAAAAPYQMVDGFEVALSNSLSPDRLQHISQNLRFLATDKGMSDIMQRNKDLDIVLSSSESNLVNYAALAGWPCAAVPVANWRKNGQPYGMFAISKNGDERTLLHFISVWGRVFKGACAPDLEMMA